MWYGKTTDALKKHLESLTCLGQVVTLMKFLESLQVEGRPEIMTLCDEALRKFNPASTASAI